MSLSPGEQGGMSDQRKVVRRLGEDHAGPNETG